MLRRGAALLAATALLAGCGGADKEKVAHPAATATQTAAAPSLKDTSQKPEIAKPTGKPPQKLVVKDIVKGKGPAAKAGDTVSMQYVGVNFSSGRQFDASWDRGQPFQFQLGAGMVIPGWDKGIVGMKRGGRRELIIPPNLGYGPSGTPDGSIPPNETLVFVVDLQQIG